MQVDLNCDLGEGCPCDAELLALITSANVCCGGHAGDPTGIFGTLMLARQHGVQIGAHPGFPEREHFGRRERDCDPHLVFEECLYQIGALAGLARGLGVPVRYVKPHGALYHQACSDEKFALPVAQAARAFDLPVMALPGSRLEQATKRLRLRFVTEGFADRRYQPDGTLVPRSQPNALIESPQEAVAQAEWLIRERGVQTICVHGDNAQAVEFVRRLRESLIAQGVDLRPFDV